MTRANRRTPAQSGHDQTTTPEQAPHTFTLAEVKDLKPRLATDLEQVETYVRESAEFYATAQGSATVAAVNTIRLAIEVGYVGSKESRVSANDYAQQYGVKPPMVTRWRRLVALEDRGLDQDSPLWRRVARDDVNGGAITKALKHDPPLKWGELRKVVEAPKAQPQRNPSPRAVDVDALKSLLAGIGSDPGKYGISASTRDEVVGLLRSTADTLAAWGAEAAPEADKAEAPAA